MEVFRSLDSLVRHPASRRLPPTWQADHTLGALRSSDEIVEAIRWLDDVSDVVAHALLSQEQATDLAMSLLTLALLPLAVRRSGRGREAIDDALAELGIAVAEARREIATVSSERLVRRIFNRASARSWRAANPRSRPVTCDPVVCDWIASDDNALALASVVDRVAIRQLREAVEARSATLRGLGKAWNSVVELSAKEFRSPVEQDRLKYARRVLHRHGVAEMVA